MIKKISRSVTIDEELLKLSSELLANRSESAEDGILKAVIERITQFSPEVAEQYLQRIEHLID